MNRRNVIRTVTAVAVLVLLGWSFFYFSDDTRGYKPVDTSVAMTQINSDNVKSAQIDDREQQVRLTLKKGNNDTENSDKVITKYPTGYGVDLFNALTAKNAKVSTVVNEGSLIGELLVYVLPLVLLVGLFVMFSRVQGGARMGFGFGKSRAKQLSKDMPKTTFADVAGVDEAVEELYEIKDFLQNPSRYQALGAKIPKGVLLYGPPGTGKTLLAKAVAKEAEANFIAIKSSDLLSKWYGESEQQIAKLFARARQVAPCVVFIDEIDSLVPARGTGVGEPQVTARVVNTILAEMDGLEELQSVVLIGATNRPNLVDPALLRPGRFDELVYVGTPSAEGRARILRIHTKAMPLAGDVDLDRIAAETERFTGADLEDVVRRAGLNAIRRAGGGVVTVNAADFADALEHSRATVTPEMEEDYARMKGELKKRAMEPGPLGFITPGMVQSTREAKHR